MDLSFVLGLIFAVATAIATNLAFLWKHRGAVAAPAVDLHHPVRSAGELFRSKWWSIGWAVAVVGWVAHVGALALVPLSLAQAVIAAPSAIISPWTATALIASVGAFYTSARSLQIGDGIAVITATTAAANLATIAGGIIVFGERLGDSAGESILRLAAFGLVIAGAVLMPGPTRAAEAGAEEERREREPRVTRAPRGTEHFTDR